MDTKDLKPVTANETILLMIHAVNDDKFERFYAAGNEYASSLARGGDWYRKIQGTLSRRPHKMIPLAELSFDTKKLISQVPVSVENMCLSDDIKAKLDDLLFEWKNAEIFLSHNLPISSKILLHGPTGNGKTTLAKYISLKAELPFVEVNSDTLVDSHLGSTGANIHKLMSAIKQPCVLFWDEIDTIGRSRGNVNDGSAAAAENDRMVNSVLVNMDKLHPGVILIGATNRIEIMDSAFLRRFHDKIEVKAPTIEERQVYLFSLHDYYNIKIEDMDSTDLLWLESYSEIKRRFLSKARHHVSSIIKESIIVNEG